MTINLAWETQIALLLVEEIIGPETYSDFADVFSKESAEVLPKHKEINKYAIELQKGKQPSYSPIYSLGSVELETLKTYIETNLANSFILPLTFSAKAPILFVQKSDGSLCLYVNYQGLNNLIIKNWYPLPLIEKFLDLLAWAKRFTQLDFTSAYYQMRIKEGNEWKTAFQTRYGHFKYQVMLFGPFKALASF